MSMGTATFVFVFLQLSHLVNIHDITVPMSLVALLPDQLVDWCVFLIGSDLMWAVRQAGRVCLL